MRKFLLIGLAVLISGCSLLTDKRVRGTANNNSHVITVANTTGLAIKQATVVVTGSTVDFKIDDSHCSLNSLNGNLAIWQCAFENLDNIPNLKFEKGTVVSGSTTAYTVDNSFYPDLLTVQQ